MDEFVKMAELTSNYVAALRRGLDKFAGMLPVMVDQHIRQQASDKLNTTRDPFLSAVKTTMIDYVLIVTLDEDNWIANAVENGADPFNMKETHLKSPKARYTKPDKNGQIFKYLRIPIGKSKDAKPGTQKGQDLQKKINDIMMKPQFGMSRLRTQIDGRVSESQQVLTSDPDLRGLYRVRQFANPQEVHGNKKPQWNLVMFRTMSENPLARGGWEHPGIRPVGIFKETQNWLSANVDAMLETFLDTELEKLEDLK